MGDRIAGNRESGIGKAQDLVKDATAMRNAQLATGEI